MVIFKSKVILLDLKGKKKTVLLQNHTNTQQKKHFLLSNQEKNHLEISEVLALKKHIYRSFYDSHDSQIWVSCACVLTQGDFLESSPRLGLCHILLTSGSYGG